MATLKHLRDSEYDSRIKRAEVTGRYEALRGLINDDVQLEKELAEINMEVDLSLKAKNLSKDKLLQANKKLFRRYVARAIISQGAKILKDLEEMEGYDYDPVEIYKKLCHRQACLFYKYVLCSQYVGIYGRSYSIISNEICKIEIDKCELILIYDVAYSLIRKIETVYHEQLNKKCSGFMEIYDKIMNEGIRSQINKNCLDVYLCAEIMDKRMYPSHYEESLFNAAYKTIGRCLNIDRLDVSKLLDKK
jgi:hypothetical protein